MVGMFYKLQAKYDELALIRQTLSSRNINSVSVHYGFDGTINIEPKDVLIATAIKYYDAELQRLANLIDLANKAINDNLSEEDLQYVIDEATD